MKSSEQIARTAYEGLSVRGKLLVMSWRQWGNDWFTSMINSGVLLTGWRLRP